MIMQELSFLYSEFYLSLKFIIKMNSYMYLNRKQLFKTSDDLNSFTILYYPLLFSK